VAAQNQNRTAVQFQMRVVKGVQIFNFVPFGSVRRWLVSVGCKIIEGWPNNPEKVYFLKCSIILARMRNVNY
jgi:hypothetical protein